MTVTRAKTAAERKRAQRERMATAVELEPPEQWSEATCLQVLGSAKFKGTKTGEAAWRRLGEIHGYATLGARRDSHGGRE